MMLIFALWEAVSYIPSIVKCRDYVVDALCGSADYGCDCPVVAYIQIIKGSRCNLRVLLRRYASAEKLAAVY